MGYAQHLTYTNYTYKDGLPSNQVHSITASSNGNILIGSIGNSVFQFDGRSFKEFNHPLNKNEHKIVRLHEYRNSIYGLSAKDGLFKTTSGITSPFYYKVVDDQYLDFLVYQKKFYLFKSKSYLVLNEDGKLIAEKKYPNNTKLTKVTAIIPQKDLLVVLSPNINFIATDTSCFTTTDYFKVDKNRLANYQYGYNLQGIVHLFDSTLSKGIIINMESPFLSAKDKIIPFALHDSDRIVAQHWDQQSGRLVLILNNGDLILERNYKISRIPKNSDLNAEITSLYVDQYDNFWAGTKDHGLFKIHFSLFTKLQYAEEYANREIFFTHNFKNNQILFSTRRPDITYHGNIYDGQFKKYPFRILDKVEESKQAILATTNGVYQLIYDQNSIHPFTPTHTLKGKQINAITDFKNGYLIIEKGRTCYYLNKETGHITNFVIPNLDPTLYIRALRYNSRKKILYLGTNSGVYSWEDRAAHLTKISNLLTGGDCANSAVDIFGTIWFTTQNGILGITSSGKKVFLNDPQIFKHNIFYNIEADSYGQLLIGTNRGFIIIKVNNEGIVIAHKSFDSGNGFEGYDTNMRSSSIDDNQILIGTSDGLFSIDLEFHNSEFVPSKPAVNSLTIHHENRSITFKTLSIHPKFKEVYYSYLIKEIDSEWSEFSLDDKFTIPNLAPGKYTLLVRSSYDKDKVSNVSTTPFEIKQTINNNAYILYISVGIGALLTLFIYFRIRRRNSQEEFYKEDFFILQYISPFIILATGLLNISAHLIGYVLVKGYYFNTLVLVIGLIVCVGLYLFARRIHPSERYIQMKKVIITHFLVILLINEWILHQSNIEPFVCLIILIVINFSPFIFERTASITVFAISAFIANVTIAYSIPSPRYSPELYSITMATAGVAVFFINTIRHQSLNQLAFVSTIINNSDIYAVAFDGAGKIMYASNNFSGLLRNDSLDVAGEHVNILLDYFPEGINLPINDIMNEFVDGRELYLPLQFNNDPVSWIVWECKQLNKDTRVLLGTDITEKMALQDTYEILVENAQDLIYKVNEVGEFQFLNNKFNDYLPQDKNTYIGKRLTEIVHPDYKEQVREYYNRQIVEKDKVSYFEFPLLDKNGNSVWIGQYMTLLHEIGYNNRITGCLVTGRDITDKRTKQQLITNQSNSIKDSINYAKRIQKNLMNSGTRFDNYFAEHTIIFKPKDIVSGDFYWCIRIEDQTVVAVGDCTGHGVPGAFMSILAINLLNNVVITSKITDPGAIMNELDIRLRSILANAEDSSFRDGVELTIITFDNHTDELHYSCAGSKFIIHNGTSFDIFRGDIKHIGDEQDYFGGYVTNITHLEPWSTVYLFTDGCHDQFGGNHNKKFTMRRLIELIAENINLPLKNQGTIFTEEFNNWRGTQDQTDDITLVGIRPKNNNNN